MFNSKEDLQREILRMILPHYRTSIALSVGAGKTLIGLRHMENNFDSDNPKFLVVAPKLSIFDSWINEAKKFNIEYLLDHITFTTYLSLYKQSYDYDVVYLEEVQNITISCDPWLSVYPGKILGLTGTPPKFEGSDKFKMISRYCPIVCNYTTDNAIEDKIINDYRILVHLIPLDESKTLKVTTKNKSWYTSEKKHYEYLCRRISDAKSTKDIQFSRLMRMRGLMTFPSKESLALDIFKKTPGKCILFANTKDQADRMCEYSYHSSNPDSEENLMKFNSGEITKLSSVLQLNEGINIKDLTYAIIMHSYSGNSSKLGQKQGRVHRLPVNEVAKIHLLVYKDTIDEIWAKGALEGLDPKKIKYLTY